MRVLNDEYEKNISTERIMATEKRSRGFDVTGFLEEGADQFVTDFTHLMHEKSTEFSFALCLLRCVAPRFFLSLNVWKIRFRKMRGSMLFYRAERERERRCK